MNSFLLPSSSKSRTGNYGVQGKAIIFFILAVAFLLIQLSRIRIPVEDNDNAVDEDILAMPPPMERGLASSSSLTTGQKQQQIPQERAFYEDHYQNIRTLINTSSVLVWEARTTYGKTFGPLFDLFPKRSICRANGKSESDLKRFIKGRPYVHWGSICEAALYFGKQRQQQQDAIKPMPHVLFFQLNENWGGLSQAIRGKTANWSPDLVRQEWKREGCKNSTVFNYLKHPDTLLAITTQFQIFDHPKVHSLPLGIQKVSKTEFLLDQLDQSHNRNQLRTQLLMVNSKARSMRKAAIDAVIRNFHGTVKNTFGKGDDSVANYYQEMQRSKFIFSPGGLGFDCYRHWEALYMGTIPVLETLNRTDGWFRTFDDLPVAWIDSYDNLTPAFLEREYQRIIARAGQYNYAKLTKQWWGHFIESHVPVELRAKT